MRRTRKLVTASRRILAIFGNMNIIFNTLGERHVANQHYITCIDASREVHSFIIHIGNGHVAFHWTSIERTKQRTGVHCSMSPVLENLISIAGRSIPIPNIKRLPDGSGFIFNLAQSRNGDVFSRWIFPVWLRITMSGEYWWMMIIHTSK